MSLEKLKKQAIAFLEAVKTNLESDGEILAVCLADVEVGGEHGLLCLGGLDLMADKDALAMSIRKLVGTGKVLAIYLICEIWTQARGMSMGESERLIEELGAPGNWPEDKRGEAVLVNAQSLAGTVFAKLWIDRIDGKAFPGGIEIAETPVEKAGQSGGRFSNFFVPRAEDLGDHGIHTWQNAPCN